MPALCPGSVCCVLLRAAGALFSSPPPHLSCSRLPPLSPAHLPAAPFLLSMHSPLRYYRFLSFAYYAPFSPSACAPRSPEQHPAQTNESPWHCHISPPSHLVASSRGAAGSPPPPAARPQPLPMLLWLLHALPGRHPCHPFTWRPAPPICPRPSILKTLAHPVLLHCLLTNRSLRGPGPQAAAPKPPQLPPCPTSLRV